MTSNSIQLFKAKNILVDIGILLAIYFIPSLSHLIGIPLYYLDPMRLFLLFGYFITPQHDNSILLAISIPFFSYLVSGHPILLKAFLISAELLINLLLLISFINLRKFTLSQKPVC